MKRVQVLLEPDCHKIIKCACAQMGVTMSEYFILCSIEYLKNAMKDDDQLQQLLMAVPLTPGSRAYKTMAQDQLDAHSGL